MSEKLRYHRALDAQAEIHRLEGLLELQVSERLIGNIREANARVEQLTQIAKRLGLDIGTATASSAPRPAPAPAAVPVPAVLSRATVATPTTSPRLNRAQCLSIMKDIFGEGFMAFIELSDSQLREDCEARLKAEGLNLAGEPAVKISRSGLAAVMHAEKQRRLNQLLPKH
jgi:hypothetical protein